MSRKQSGAALITVLVIVFIVVSMITNITVRNYRIIKRLTNRKILEQSYGVLYAVTNLGRVGLAMFGANTEIDTLNDVWAQPFPATKVVNDIEASVAIIDEQGKFNINDLVNPSGQINEDYVHRLANLLLYLRLPQSIARNIALYIAHPEYQQEIMGEYARAIPAYRPAGRILVDLSELLLVAGMNTKVLQVLSKYITAIPNTNDVVKVNVNTASAEVIAAISDMPLDVARRIVTIRSAAPFHSAYEVNSFLGASGIIASQQANPIDVDNLTVSSSYFTIHVTVYNNNYEFKSVTMVHRLNRSGQWPVIIWQHPE